MEKKDYLIPEMETITLQVQQGLLAGSGSSIDDGNPSQHGEDDEIPGGNPGRI